VLAAAADGDDDIDAGGQYRVALTGGCLGFSSMARGT
jgi:hypothetical protein